jgi:putative transposase
MSGITRARGSTTLTARTAIGVLSRYVFRHEGLLTLTIKMRVSPEPESGEELISLMKRYREALNYAIEVVIENKALSLGKAHKLLYSVLKERCGLPSKVAQDCYREAITVAKS